MEKVTSKKVATPTYKVIDTEFIGKQTHGMKIVTKIGDKKVKFFMYSDSYDHQCKSYSEVWTDNGWTTVHRVRPNNQSFPSKMEYSRLSNKQAEMMFKSELKKLKKVTKEILF